MKKRKSIRAFSFFFVLCILLTACGEVVLYNDLSQEDANKVMVLLQQNGINALLEQEIKQNEVVWILKVNKENLSKARELIVTSNVISPRSPGLQEIYQGKGSGGWIRTPAEERARYILALKGEIINSLKKMPEVVDVDVVLNTPQEEEINLGEKKKPTASIVIKAQTPQHGATTLQESKIQEFVANSVEGMSPRDVSIMINYAAPMATILRPGETITLPKTSENKTLNLENKNESAPVRLMGLKLDLDSRERLKIYLIVFFGVLVLLSIALIVSIIQSSRVRNELKALKGGGALPALEGQIMEEQNPRLRGGQRDEE
ncbi:MAG: hypothetical protein Q7T03_02555 [Deltaproteobacteria bacterium]|nr:hypothetical protein [Deltaproteobacteria bacterium]